MQFSDIRNKAIGLIVWSQLTSKVKRFIAIKFGLLSAKNRPSLYAVFGRGINISVQHFFSGFQKGLALLPSSNGSEVITVLMRVTRIQAIMCDWDPEKNSLVEQTKILTSPLIDGATYGLLKPIFCLIYGIQYILK